MTKQEASAALLKEDNAWGMALDRAYGKAAAQARYDNRGRGLPDTKLRVLYDRRMAALKAWHKACNPLLHETA